jgi:hypothetical protein
MICWIRNFGIFEFVIVNFLGCQIKKNGRKRMVLLVGAMALPQKPKPQNPKPHSNKRWCQKKICEVGGKWIETTVGSAQKIYMMKRSGSSPSHISKHILYKFMLWMPQ